MSTDTSRGGSRTNVRVVEIDDRCTLLARSDRTKRRVEPANRGQLPLRPEICQCCSDDIDTIDDIPATATIEYALGRSRNRLHVREVYNVD